MQNRHLRSVISRLRKQVTFALTCLCVCLYVCHYFFSFFAFIFTSVDENIFFHVLKVLLITPILKCIFYDEKNRNDSMPFEPPPPNFDALMDQISVFAIGTASIGAILVVLGVIFVTFFNASAENQVRDSRSM